MAIPADDGEHRSVAFTGLDLAGTTITGAWFEDCTFTDCDLAGAVLDRCELVGCRFVGCNLALLQVPETRLAELRFEGCKLSGVDWTSARWSSLGGAVELAFEQCTLDLSVFLGLALSEIVFDRCSLVEVDFSDCDLRQASFVRSDLDRARFSSTDLRGAHLEGATRYRIDPTRNRVAGATVSLPDAEAFLEVLGLAVVVPPTDDGGAAQSLRRGGEA